MGWKCEICEYESSVTWTDYHGEAECMNCGAPYQIIQYDENKKRIDAPARLNIKPEFVPYLKQYWIEEQRYAPNGTFLGFRDAKQRSDYEAFNKWMDAHYVVESR